MLTEYIFYISYALSYHRVHLICVSLLCAGNSGSLVLLISADKNLLSTLYEIYILFEIVIVLRSIKTVLTENHPYIIRTMSLSKPIMNLVASYLQNLYLHPIKTKAITSCVVGSAASIASQVVAGDSVRLDPVLAFGLYGLLFGGTIPHYFYNIAEHLFPEEVVAFPLVKKLIFERLIFAPLMQAFSLYTLARFEGKNHSAAKKQLFALYTTVLEANWKWLTLFQIINMAFVPPMLRVLFMNLVGFCWAMFLANKRRQMTQKKDDKGE